MTDRHSDWDIALRVAKNALDRLSFSQPVSAVALGTTTVGTIAAVEGFLHLQPQKYYWNVRTRFVLRYAAYNIIPSLIWGTQVPTTIVSSSRYLSQYMKPTSQWLFSATAIPSQRALWIQILCALRGAVAGSVVLSNIIVLTSLWQQAREEYANRIRLGREPPLPFSSHRRRQRPDGCSIRLAGLRSNVTELSLHRQGPSKLWPVYENSSLVQQSLIARYAHHTRQLPCVPFYWQVNDGEYSKKSSWNGMVVPKEWLYTISGGENKNIQMLHLEADATAGDESSLSLQRGSQYYDEMVDRDEQRLHNDKQVRWGQWAQRRRNFVRTIGQVLTSRSFSELDLDLKEVAQGFRHLADLAQENVVGGDDTTLQVIRVLLVDPTVIIESGGGRQTTVRERVEELGLADIVIDARGSVLRAILMWLAKFDGENEVKKAGTRSGSWTTDLKPVILETPSKVWFYSIRIELRKHGYDVIDRADAIYEKNDVRKMPPMLVYERSSADTVHTMRQYIERGIVKDPSRVCALLTSYDGLDEIDLLNASLAVIGTIAADKNNTTVGCICSSDIHDRAFEWVRAKLIQGTSCATIQKELDCGTAWCISE